MSFGSNLSRLRTERGPTHKELATRAGLSHVSVAKYERGMHEPTWSAVLALAGVLGVSCEAFQDAPGPVGPQELTGGAPVRRRVGRPKSNGRRVKPGGR